MFKKFLSFCLAITMILSCISFQAFAQTTTVDTTAAPYAGVYQVTSNKAVTLTNETGHKVTLAAGATDYIYLIKGANSITTTNSSATVTYTALANNGMDYLNEVDAGTVPLANAHSDQVAISGGSKMAVGAEVTVTLNVPVSGLYYVSLQSPDKKVSTIYIESDTGFYGEMTPYTGNLQYAVNEANPKELITMYLRAGTTTLTLKNLGEGTANLTSVQAKQTQELTGIDAYIPQLNMAHCKVVVDNAIAEPTPTPATTNTISYTAPYAGVYQVTSDKAVTLTNETGHTVTLAAGATDYFYLIKGANNITTTNASANVTYTVLENNGMDHLAEVVAGTVPLANDHSTQVAVSGGSNMAVGAETAVTLNVPVSGLYYVSLQSPDKNVSTIYIESDTGFYGEMTPYTGNLQYAINEENPKELITMYLRAGTTTLTLKNLGEGTANLTSIQAKQTAELSGIDAYIPQLNMAHCKVVEHVVYPDYVTIPNINLPGTASNLAGCLIGGTGASALDSGFIWVSAGCTADFTVPCTDEGVYIVQIKSSNSTNVQIEVNGTYYTGVTMSANTFSNKREDGSYAFIYLNEGDNAVSFYNAGNTGLTLYNLEFKATSPLYEQGTACDESLCLKLAEDTPRPTPSETAAPTSTPLPTATPTPTPDMTDAEQFTVYEAESVTFEGVSTATYNGKTAIVATDGYNLVYPITVENDTTYNLYVTGAAWKDVTLDIRIDGVFYKNYYQYFHLEGKSSTYEYQQDLVATFPLAKGSHTITIIPYADTYYFDSFVLEDHSSRGYKFIHGFEGVNTSQEAYDLLKETAQTADINLAADTANLLCPEMNFWSMVGKDYGVKEDAIAAYNWTLENPVVTATNANGNKLNAGNSTVTIDCSSIPTNVTLYAGVYNSTGNKLLGNVNIVPSNGKTVTINLTDVAAGSTLKVFAISDVDEIKPHTSDGVYAHLYVATNGKGTNSGTSPDAPLATIAQALTKVKTLNTNMTGDIIVHVAPGIYRSNISINIDPTMSGKNGYKVIIRAEDPNNKPVISGGEDLTSKWTKVSGQNYWVASTTTRETRALYVNGYQATLAKTEFHFDGWGYITPVDPLNETHTADGINVNLSYETAFPRNLEGISGMMLVTNAAFANQRLPVDKVTYTTSENMAHIYITRPRYHALLNNLVYSIAPSYGQNYYLENSLLFLDQPGEFFFDKSARKMYYYPYANEDMYTAETYCAVTDYLVNITGVSLDNPVENITFDGLAFKYGANDKVTADGAAFTQTDEQWLGGETWFGQYLFPAQVTLDHASGIEILNCEFANLGSNALNIINGSNNVKVSGNYFHDISGTAVVVGHTMLQDGTAARDRVNTVEVDNNIIDRCAQEFLNTTGISLYYAGNVNIHHNDISNMPYSGIVAGWGWGAANPTDVKDNTIAYNKIQNVMNVLTDGAHIYTVGKMDNLHIHDNYLIDPGNHLRGGIYLDECTNNTYITDNVITNANDSNDRWLFARKYVNLADIYCGYNHTDGQKPSTISQYPFDSGAVTMDANKYNVKEWDFVARKIMSCAGVEDTTRFDNIPAYPTWRTMRMLDNPITANN